MLVIGSDPGLTGAMTLLAAGRGVLECVDIPTCENGLSSGSMKRWVDVEALERLLGEWSHRHEFARESVTSVIERPIPMPSLPAQTIASQFDTFGTIRAVLGARTTVRYVTPQEWKKIFGIGNDKDKARQVAGALYPDSADLFKRVRDHNRAESCLVAHFWLKVKS